MNSISPDLNIMIKASEKASKILIRDFGEVEKLQVSTKGPFDFVSNADIKAEKIIIEELIKSKRNYSIISEEGENKTGNDKDNVWIIDPIDGTINFLHGVPHFAISIALKGQTVSSSYKPAVLNNGLKIQVPPFIENEDIILVDTRTIEYVKKI